MASIYFSEKYSDNVNMPDYENLSDIEKREPAYNLSMARYFYSLYCRNQTEIGSDYIDMISEYRSYAEGKQSVDRYKSYFAGNKSSLSDIDTKMVDQYYRKGWMNIDFNNLVSFIPTLLNAIRGALLDIDYNVSAEPIDYDSGYEEERLMHQMIVKNKFSDIWETLYKMNNTPVPDDIQLPIEYDDLQEMRKDGLFKEPYIREHEKLLKDFFNYSEWDSSLRDKLLNDLLITKYAFVHQFYDLRTGKVKAEYIDPANVVIQYSDQYNFSDSDFAGFLKWVPISEIKACKDYIINGSGNSITDNDIKNLASSYSKIYTNKSFDGSVQKTSSNTDINEMKVLVFQCYWRDVSKEKRIEYESKSGRKKTYKYDNTVKKLSDRERIVEMRERRLYGARWIVNSDWVFNYGPVANQGYIGNEPWLPIRGVKMETESLVARIIPIANVFAISFLKFLNGLSKATEGGYAIDVTRLMFSDPNKFNPIAVIKQFIEGNFLFYQTSGNLNVGGTPVPITMIPGTLREFIEPWMQQLQWCISFTENLTGIPLMMIGSTPKPDTAVGVTQMTLQSAQNSLRTYVNKLKIIKEDLATGASQMIQLACKYNEKARESYAIIVGSSNLYTLLEAKYLPIQYGIIMRAKPDAAMRQSILQMVDEMVMNGRNGQPGLTPDQAIYIKEQIFSGATLSEMRLTIKKWVEKDRRRLQAEKERLSLLVAQENQKTVQLQTESAEKIEQLRHRAMVVDQDLKTRSAMLIDNNKYIIDLNKMIADYQLKTGGNIDLLKQKNDVESQPNIM